MQTIINFFNGEGDLLSAAGHGDLTKVQYSLKNGAAINDQKSQDGATALIRAAKNGHCTIVKFLLDKGANVDKVNKFGSTALLIAVTNGHGPVATLLLDKGADVNHANRCGMTAITIAAKNGHESVVKLLLDKGADANQATTLGTTALLIAVKNGHGSIVSMLLDKGADVNQATMLGDTALLIAAMNGHGFIVKLLLNKGADVDRRNQCGSTALIIAAMNGHEAVVTMLLNKGADVNLANKEGKTASIECEVKPILRILDRARELQDSQAAEGQNALSSVLYAEYLSLKDFPLQCKDEKFLETRKVGKGNVFMRRIEDARALRIHRATLGYKPSGMSAAEMRARLLVLLPKIEARCSSHGGAEDDGNHEICLDYAGRIKKMLAEYPPTAIAVPVASPSPTAAKSPVSVPEELSPRRPERVVKVITVVKSKPAQQAPPVQH